MKIRTLACMAAALPCLAHAQSLSPSATPSAMPAQATAPTVSMDAIKVEASADASASGLAEPYAGGQVARGGRVGLLGTRDLMDTPFSITSYTNELIQDRQARSVGDVLQNDAGVRVARGFGNFRSRTSSAARTTWPTTACTACCRANTSPPSCSSGWRCCAAHPPS